MSYPAETNNNQVTSWIPLTTPFTVPESCSSLFFAEGPSLVAFDPGYGVSIDTRALCQAPAVTTWWEQSSIFEQSGLGGAHTAWSLLPLTCPVGFQTAASSLINGGASTLAFCCPNGYSVINGDGGTEFGNCASAVTSGQVLSYASRSGSSFTTLTTTMNDASYIGAVAVQGYALSAVPSSTTTTIPTSSPSVSSSSGLSPAVIFSTSSAPSTTSQSTTSLTPTQTSQPGDGLSTGAKAGIGIGAALGFIGVLALIAAIFLIRRRRTKASATAPNSTSEPTPQQDQTQHSTSKLFWQRKQDMQDLGQWNELPAERNLHELDVGRQAAELEGHGVLRGNFQGGPR